MATGPTKTTTSQGGGVAGSGAGVDSAATGSPPVQVGANQQLTPAQQLPQSLTLPEATPSPAIPKADIVTVNLFPSAHEGFGDGRKVTRQNSYNRVMCGFDATVPGELRFSNYISRITQSGNVTEPPVYAVEMVDTSPAIDQIAIFFFTGNRIYKITGGAISEVGSAALAQRATGGALHDEGTGVPFIYIAEGSLGNIQRMSAAGTVTTAAATLKRDKLASIAGFMYGSAIPSGGTQFCGISFTLPGSSPFTEALWSPITVVGRPTTSITEIKSINTIPVVIKPEGIFVYNRGLDTWENKMPAWEAMPHQDNGRGAYSLGSALIVPVGRGGAVIFNGYTVRDFSPLGPQAVPNIDTTQQLLSSVAATPIGILGVTCVARSPRGGQGSVFPMVQYGASIPTAEGILWGQMNGKLTRRGGSDDNGATIKGTRFFKTVDNMANFTDYTTEVTDGNIQTNADVSLLSTAADGDYFFVGHPKPFCGVAWITVIQNSSGASALTAEIWDGTTWVGINIVDFTLDIKSGSQRTLAQNGMIMFARDPVVSGWQRRTLGADTQSNFYVRFSTSAALGTCGVNEIQLLPWRPSIDPTNFALDGIDRAGLLPHLLLGTPQANGGSIWHDLGAISNLAASASSGITLQTALDELGYILTAEVGGSYGNSMNKIVCIGRQNVYFIETSVSDNWPFIATKGLIEFPFQFPIPDATPSKLIEVRLTGDNFDGVNNVYFYWRHSPVERWSRTALGNRLPGVVKVSQDRGGAQFQWAIGYGMSLDTTARRPTITKIEADFEILPTPMEDFPERPVIFSTQTQPVDRG